MNQTMKGPMTVMAWGVRTRDQGPVVQKVDNLIHWIAIYPVDSAIRCLNNWSLNNSNFKNSNVLFSFPFFFGSFFFSGEGWVGHRHTLYVIIIQGEESFGGFKWRGTFLLGRDERRGIF